MFARGAGQAVAQLDVNYGVDFEPFKVNDRTHCLLKFRYCEKHGLRTPNEGINQRYLKNWADVADKICFGHT